MTDTPAHSASSGTEQTSVEDQRAELAETVSALAVKADIPTRVRNEASSRAARASAAVGERPGTAAGVAGTVVVLVVVTLILRRRCTRKAFR